MDKEKVIKRFVRVKNKKLVNSFKYAICGLKSAYKREQNLKIHILIMILVVILGIILRISKIEWIICLILFALVISEELINTSIEAIVDIIMPQINPKAKLAKDVAASAVLITAIFAVIIGLIIFIPKIIH
jgi:diacylglycerol kinase